MNRHKTLKDPPQSWRISGFTQLIGNSILSDSQSKSELSLGKLGESFFVISFQQSPKINKKGIKVGT
jgi:hypothetical protein